MYSSYKKIKSYRDYYCVRYSKNDGVILTWMV
jgi:hypothetical protein